MSIIARCGLTIAIAASFVTSAIADDDLKFDCITFNYWLYPQPEFGKGEIADAIQKSCDAKVPDVVRPEEITQYIDIVGKGDPSAFIAAYGKERYARAGKIAAAARKISKEVNRQLDE
ncbi:hypothetical protein [Mesorhizobium sp. M0847]|uniref:hypothetical protein n=1 Tax=unclassified Mesorhizobium TaxID=325217 RepID=UPI003337FBB8